MCIFIERYMDIFMPVVPISSAGRRRGLRKESRALGSPCSSSGPLGEGNNIMEDTGILGLNHPGLHLLDPMKNSPMEAMPLSPEFSFELFWRGRGP